MATPIPRNGAAFTAYGVALATSGRALAGGRIDASGRGFTTDSRAVVEGSAFVALRGERHDGHEHVTRAIDAGAVLVVVEKGRAMPSPRAVVVEVDDTLLAWGALARAHLRAWRRVPINVDARRVVAITGSAGKTTTKELLLALLSVAGPSIATHGNLNNRIGLPAMAFVAGPEHRFLVLEAGMSLRGEMTELAGISEPDVVVVTNVGVAHAEGVGGTRADVAREKAALVEALGPTGVAVINADDDAAMATLARTRAGRAVTFGRSEFADYRLLDRIPIGTEGSRVTFERPCVDCASPGARETLEAELPIVGEVAALDFLAALAAAEATAGTFEKERIDTGLAKNLALSGRASIVPLADGSILVDDAYNANPGSMRAAVRTLVELAKGKGTRAIAVLGEMKELGALADAEHDALGDVLAEAGVALVVGAGGLADRTLVRAASRGTPVIHAKDSQEAARLVLPEVHPGDVVLVKASRSVAAEVVVNALVAARGLRGAGDAA